MMPTEQSKQKKDAAESNLEEAISGGIETSGENATS
jgi:hypothetical protein